LNSTASKARRARLEQDRIQRLHTAFLAVRAKIEAGAPKGSTLAALRTRRFGGPRRTLALVSLRRLFARWQRDPRPASLTRNYKGPVRPIRDVSWWTDRAVALLVDAPALSASNVLRRLDASAKRPGDRWPLSESSFRRHLALRLGSGWQRFSAEHRALRIRFHALGRERLEVLRHMKALRSAARAHLAAHHSPSPRNAHQPKLERTPQ
jgi:hypothetical protein